MENYFLVVVFGSAIPDNFYPHVQVDYTLGNFPDIVFVVVVVLVDIVNTCRTSAHSVYRWNTCC